MLGLRTPPQKKREYNTQPSPFQGEDDSYYRSQAPSALNNNFSDSSPNPPRRAYMSSLASMYGDYEANVARKRRLQEELAESLRQQIEEKKGRTSSRRPVARQASDMLHEMQNTNETSSPPKPLAATLPQPQRIVSFAQPINLGAPSHYSHANEVSETWTHAPAVERFSGFRSTLGSETGHSKTIHVPTESPFARQTIGTPPLGFSIRRSQPVKSSLSGATKGSVQKRVLPQTLPRSSLGNPKPTFLAQNTYQEKSDDDYQYAGPPNGDDAWELQRLDSQTELIYPDGHISAR